MLEKNDVRTKAGSKNGRHDVSTAAKQEARETGRDAGKSAKAQVKPRKPGVAIRRFFTKPGDDGFTNVAWDLRTANITGENGKVVFEQRDVEVPRNWSQTATNVGVQMYFRGTVGTPER